jgi:hypothetical protein
MSTHTHKFGDQVADEIDTACTDTYRISEQIDDLILTLGGITDDDDAPACVVEAAEDLECVARNFRDELRRRLRLLVTAHKDGSPR